MKTTSNRRSFFQLTCMSDNNLAIYYEHPEWFRPLFAELERRGVAFSKIDGSNHSYDPAEAKKYSLFFNRMSASAYLRGHGNAIFYTLGLLASLERQGVRVINGHVAFQIEISKGLQAALFDSLGVKYPKTRVVNSVDQILAASRDLAFPILVKPNIGGRGAGIIKFDSPEQLADATEREMIDLGMDSTVLVQEFAPKMGGSIQRIEMLGGKFLYGLKIFPDGENFNLCPAEVCRIDDAQSAGGPEFSGEICLTEAPKSGLRIERFEPPGEIVETVERIVGKALIDVGGVEYLIDERTGTPLFYDINALSNFVADAENLIRFDPHERLVDFLLEEIEKCDTDTGCRSSGVG
jgi:glutathione synthase/RimK-type ligase-like ATP-grasp enzyme